MAILAVVDDLVFRSKLDAAAAQMGVSLHVAAGADALAPLPDQSAWQVAVVDLNLSAGDPLEAISTIRRMAPTVPVVGFCSHGQAGLHLRAKQAGCTTVLSRLAFVTHLPQWLQGSPPSSCTWRG